LLNRAKSFTFLVAVNFSDEDSAALDELGRDLVGGLVPDGGEHVAEAAPVRVEIDKDELIFGWKNKFCHVIKRCSLTVVAKLSLKTFRIITLSLMTQSLHSA
jgi:hypothetical protein